MNSHLKYVVRSYAYKALVAGLGLAAFWGLIGLAKFKERHDRRPVHDIKAALGERPGAAFKNTLLEESMRDFQWPDWARTSFASDAEARAAFLEVAEAHYWLSIDQELERGRRKVLDAVMSPPGKEVPTAEEADEVGRRLDLLRKQREEGTAEVRAEIARAGARLTLAGTLTASPTVLGGALDRDSPMFFSFTMLWYAALVVCVACFSYLFLQFLAAAGVVAGEGFWNDRLKAILERTGKVAGPDVAKAAGAKLMALGIGVAVIVPVVAETRAGGQASRVTRQVVKGEGLEGVKAELERVEVRLSGVEAGLRGLNQGSGDGYSDNSGDGAQPKPEVCADFEVKITSILNEVRSIRNDARACPPACLSEVVPILQNQTEAVSQLLRGVGRCTDPPTLESIKQAVEGISNDTKYVRAGLREQEQRRQMLEVQSALVDPRGLVSRSLTGRVYQFGPVTAERFMAYLSDLWDYLGDARIPKKSTRDALPGVVENAARDRELKTSSYMEAVVESALCKGTESDAVWCEREKKTLRSIKRTLLWLTELPH